MPHDLKLIYYMSPSSNHIQTKAHILNKVSIISFKLITYTGNIKFNFSLSQVCYNYEDSFLNYKNAFLFIRT